VAGAAISVFGLICQIAALSHLSISIVQSIGVFGIILLVLLSQLHLRESLATGELYGLAVAVAGFVLVALSLSSGADAPGRKTPELATLLCALVTFAVAGCLLLLKSSTTTGSGVSYGLGAGLFYGLSGIGAKGVSAIIASDGLVHGVGALFSTVFLYVFVAGWVLGLAIFQFGIQRSRVGIVGPLSTMVSGVFFVAAGTPIFGEHFPAAVGPLIARVSGFACLVVGSLIVARGSSVGPADRVLADGPMVEIDG
jgi:hypothetical protein